VPTLSDVSDLSIVNNPRSLWIMGGRWADPSPAFSDVVGFGFEFEEAEVLASLFIGRRSVDQMKKGDGDTHRPFL
jgi:hypothetical protein